MGTPYVGEIRIFAGTFAPNGWLFCDGRPLSTYEYDVLFQLIGTTYGGDGQEYFNLPDLRGRVPIHQGTGPGTTYQTGQAAGVEQVTLTTGQMPTHSHALVAARSAGVSQVAAGNVIASSPSVDLFYGSQPDTAMSPQMLSQVGGSQPHENMQPYLCVHFIISLFGVFPSQT